ncbi:MAG: hypothetical protein MJK04_25375, partial [Psychrosphaera sp.]|nr:hypothetical protein [Psychrosphaera sp.]
RMHAAAMGIFSKNAFESKFYLSINQDRFAQTSNGPGKAWDGKNPQFKQAQEVAEFLGLNHYSQLQLNNAQSQWSTLLENTDHSQTMFDLVFDEEDQWRSVDFTKLYQRNFDELETVGIEQRWHLRLKGVSGDSFAVFLQSDKSLCQIAPNDPDICLSTIQPKARVIAVPPQPLLGFDKNEGFGWRRFIVIRAKFMPLPAKSKNTGHLISAQELEVFANRLLLEKDLKITVDTYELVLE